MSQGRRGISIRLAACAAVIAGAAIVVTGPAASAAEPAVCPLAPIWVNTPQQLIAYTPTGEEWRSVPVPSIYGDIAWSADGTTLYGIGFDNGDVAAAPMLYVLDPETGDEIDAVAVTGAIVDIENEFVDAAVTRPGRQLNGLTALPDGTLLVGSAVTHQIFVLDPTSGVSTPFDVAFPPGADGIITSAGDFLTLADGDILAIGMSPDLSYSIAFRLHHGAGGAYTVTEIGTLPTIFGAAQSGGSIFLATASGDLSRVLELPTAASTAPLATETVVAGGGMYYGATSIQDAGTCNVQPPTGFTVAKSASPTSAVAVGDVVTYTITVTNTGDFAYPDGGAGFSDDLTDVLASAELVEESMTASAGAVSLDGEVLSWVGPLDVGATVTVSYQVTVTEAGVAFDNIVVPVGIAGSCAAEDACAVTVTSTPDDGESTSGKPDKSGKGGKNSKGHHGDGDHSDELASTGVPAGAMAALGGLLLVTGVLALAAGRRTRRAHHRS